MKRLLIFASLISSACIAQTNLPGPVRVLPNAGHTIAYGPCSYNATQSNLACFTSATGLSANKNIVVSDAAYTFDNSIVTTGDLKGATLHVTSMAGSGTRCVQVDNNGAFSTYSLGCPGGGGGGAPFTDASPIMFNSADNTKLLSFALGGFTTGTTRTLTPQNASYTIAGTDISNSFSAAQAISATLTLSGTPAVTLSGNILPATDDTRQIGDSTHNLTALFTHTIFNEVAGTALGITGGTSAAGIGIAVATSTSSDMVFYPNAAEAFRIKANKDLLVSGGNIKFSNNSSTIGDATNQVNFIDAQNHYGLDPMNTANYCRFGYLGMFCTQGATTEFVIDGTTGAITSTAYSGSGTRCVQVDNAGAFSVFSAGCGGSGTTNIVLANACSAITLSGSYQDVCSNTVTATGVWMILPSIQLTVNPTTSSAVCALNINGSLLSPSTFGYAGLSNANGGASQFIQATASQTWVETLNSGDVVKIQCIAAAGGGATGAGSNYTLVYLRT